MSSPLLASPRILKNGLIAILTQDRIIPLADLTDAITGGVKQESPEWRDACKKIRRCLEELRGRKLVEYRERKEKPTGWRLAPPPGRSHLTYAR